MKIRIVKSGPGCVFDEGQVIRVGDHQASEWIRQGYAVPFDGVAGVEPMPVMGQKRERPAHPAPRTSRPSAHMLPPRFIAPDGFVAKDAEHLAEYIKANP